MAPCSPPSRTLCAAPRRGGLAAILDRGCARRLWGVRPGRRNGRFQPNQETQSGREIRLSERNFSPPPPTPNSEEALNPAVTVGLAAGGRFPLGQVLQYIGAQLVGAIAASTLLYFIASGAAGFDLAKGFAANGYEAHSPGHYSMTACFLMEVVMTMMFLFIIMGGDAWQGAGRLCTIGDRVRARPDSPRQHSCHQYVGQSGA